MNENYVAGAFFRYRCSGLKARRQGSLNYSELSNLLVIAGKQFLADLHISVVKRGR